MFIITTTSTFNSSSSSSSSSSVCIMCNDIDINMIEVISVSRSKAAFGRPGSGGLGAKFPFQRGRSLDRFFCVFVFVVLSLCVYLLLLVFVLCVDAFVVYRSLARFFW